MVEGHTTRIHVCGRLTVELSGRRLEESLRGRQGRLLFAYLTLHRERPVRRDELAEALWNGKGTPPASESLLAPPLSRLRKALGPGVLEGRTELQLILQPDAWIDWEVAPRELRRAGETTDPQAAWDAAKSALAIIEGGLLPGLEAPWIDAKRSELADLRVEALETLALAGARLGGTEYPAAEQAARAAVAAQPYRESARAALMEVLRARGNANEALRVYEDIRVLLREELGSSPGATLVALHAQLLRDDPAAPSEPPPPRQAKPKAPASLVEREREVALLDTLLEEAIDGEGRAVLIEGPPGIGKSRLMAEFRRRAVADGAAVLTARAGELEREFPFGVVRQLFEAVVADAAVLAGAAAPAGVVFRSPDEHAVTGGDASFAALHGLYWLTLNLAAEQPLLLEIDDLHWCDRASLRFLAYLVRRLEGQPVLVAASVRTSDAPTDTALLAEIANDPATVHVRPGPLSEEAVGALVARRLGAEPDRAFREACHTTTGGNPLLVRQLLNALETDAVKPDAAHADVVRAIGSRAVSSSVLLRLARLPGEAATIARAVAVLGEGADPARGGGRRRPRRGAGRRDDGRARPLGDPAPRSAARLRAPARPRRRLPRVDARRARAAARARRGGAAPQRRRTGPHCGPTDEHAAPWRRRGRPVAARGGDRSDDAGGDRQLGRVPASRAGRAAARPPTARACSSISASPKHSRAGPRPRATCARPTKG